MREMMEHLLKHKKQIRSGVLFTVASPETIEYIRKTYKPAEARVTRRNAFSKMTAAK